MAYDHIFYELVTHAYSHVIRQLKTCVTPSGGEKSTHTTMMTSANRKHFPRYWPFVRGNHRSPVNSPHEGQWRGAFMFSLNFTWINRWVNTREAGDFRRRRAHYDVIVMTSRRVIHVSDPHPHLVLNMLNEIHVWTPELATPWTPILLCQKSSYVMCCPSPREAHYHEEA